MTDSFPAPGAPFPDLTLQVPETLRAMAETGVAQTRAGYARLRDAAEAGNEAIEAALENAARGAGVYAERMLELSHANTQAAFGFGVALMSTTSLPDALELLGCQARRQIETFMTQSRELAELGQQLTADMVAPLKEGTSKALAIVA